MKLRPVLLTLLAALSTAVSAQSPPFQGDAEVGKQIYLKGVLPSGRPLRGSVEGGILLEGAQVACASCHRPSGFGSSEGAVLVPPVTAGALFRDRQPQRAELFRKLYQEVQTEQLAARVRDPRIRAAYTPATLSVALRQGHDPSGRCLDQAMPRYELDDAELAHLSAYLETLSAKIDPGVDDLRIHFATVVSSGVPIDQRQAMLDVMQAYLRHKILQTRGEQLRQGHSPYYRDEFYSALRYWELHVWELQGSASDWPRQLDAFYQQQPVFALLGGLVEGDWSPIHKFCEENRVPCLFPNTSLPVISETGGYSLYLSPGFALEAQALALHLAQSGEDTAWPIQVYRDSPAGRRLAVSFRKSLQEQGVSTLQERMIEAGQSLSPGFWSELLSERPSQLVLWLQADDLLSLAASGLSLPPLYLSSTLSGEDQIKGLAANLATELYLTYPYALPGQPVPRIYRVRSWMRSRGIARTHERLQLNTYFTLSAADHSLGHLVEDFHRDYFIETLEHETENGLNPGVYPHLSLGPGQRFASKGCYIVRLSEGTTESVSGWIVP